MLSVYLSAVHTVRAQKTAIYCREHTCIFSVSNQVTSSGFLGLLCPVAEWYFPLVCSSSDGPSISEIAGWPPLPTN